MRSRLRLCLLTAASVVIVAVGLPTPALALGPNAILPGFNSTSYGPNDDGTYPCTGSNNGTPIGCTPAKITLPFSFNFFLSCCAAATTCLARDRSMVTSRSGPGPSTQRAVTAT